MNKQTTPSALERRVVAVLGGNGHLPTANELAELISDTEVEATAQAAVAEAERTKSLDLVSCPDPTEAHERIAAAKLSADRLQASLPKLRDKLQAALTAERTARFWEDYKHVKVRLDEAVEQFKTFDEHAQAIVRIFLLAAEVDKEVSRINGLASEITGIDRRLRSVELTARGLGSFSRDQPSLAANTILPNVNHSAKNLWPARPSTSLAAAYAGMAPSHPGANWSSPEETARRKAGIEADQKRSANFHEQATKDEETRINRESRERFGLQS